MWNPSEGPQTADRKGPLFDIPTWEVFLPGVNAMDSSLLVGGGGQLAHNLSIFAPASPPAESIRDLSILIFAITGFIFLVVEGVLVYSILRFRRKPSDMQGEPPQVYGSMPIEIAWTAAPCLIVFILVLVTTRTLWEVNASTSAPAVGGEALHVTVVGRQWWWEYTYDHYKGRKIGVT